MKITQFETILTNAGFAWATPEVWMQESFAEFDVPWRTDMVSGWNPIQNGEFLLPDTPGLGIELDDATCLAHPYKKHSFPSLWDHRWIENFTQTEQRLAAGESN